MKSKGLSPLEVWRLLKPGRHYVGRVAGLPMQMKPSGARGWVLRLSVGGRRCDMGPSGFPDVTLADARHRAREEHEQADKGGDPSADRRVAACRMPRDCGTRQGADLQTGGAVLHRGSQTRMAQRETR